MIKVVYYSSFRRPTSVKHSGTMQHTGLSQLKLKPSNINLLPQVCNSRSYEPLNIQLLVLSMQWDWQITSTLNSGGDMICHCCFIISNLVQYFLQKPDFRSANAQPISAPFTIKFIKYKLLNQTYFLRQDITEIKVQKVCFPTIFFQLFSNFININYFGFSSSITCSVTIG